MRTEGKGAKSARLGTVETGESVFTVVCEEFLFVFRENWIFFFLSGFGITGDRNTRMLVAITVSYARDNGCLGLHFFSVRYAKLAHTHKRAKIAATNVFLAICVFDAAFRKIFSFSDTRHGKKKPRENTVTILHCRVIKRQPGDIDTEKMSQNCFCFFLELLFLPVC